MNVLLVSTQDTGGAARACLRLLDGLREGGISAEALVLRRASGLSPAVHSLAKQGTRAQRGVRKIRRTLWERRNARVVRGRNSGWDIFSFADAPYDITEDPQYAAADIVHLHWVADFLNYATFFQKNRKKLVWTLHDMNPFTGGCHYAGACLQFQTTCTKCPQLEGAINPGFVHDAFRRKAQAVGGIRADSLVIVVLSRWMMDMSRSSDLFSRFEHRLIPNGLDSQVYRPLPQPVCREFLGLPVNRKIALFIGDDVSNVRKGYRFFNEAMERLRNTDNPPLAVVVGRTMGQAPSGNVRYWGPVADERLMAMLYSAADVYVCTSVEDNLPNTVMESLMCGTPVAGYAIGGVTDMVRDGVDGVLAPAISSEAMACAVMKILGDPDRFCRGNIRDGAVQRYALEIQAAAYRSLYEEILYAPQQ